MRGSRALVGALALSLAACGPTCQHEDLGRVTRASGQVEGDRADQLLAWESVEIGHTFEHGDGLRTGRGATAVVQVGARGAVNVHEETIVRFFARRGREGTGVAVEEGEAVLEGATDGLFFRTEIGLARLEAGTQARLKRAGESVRLDVLVGNALFEKTDGQIVRLARGDAISIDLGTAVLEPISRGSSLDGDVVEDAGSDVEPDAGGEPDDDAGVGDGAVVKPRDALDISVEGRNVTVRRGPDTPNEALLPGEFVLSPGALLTIPAGSSVRVERAGLVAASRGPSRLRLGGQGEPMVEATSGFVAGKAGASDLTLGVPGGRVIARRSNGQAEVAVSRRGAAKVVAVAGVVDVETSSGRASLRFGEIATIARNGDIEFAIKNPTHADLTVKAGESVSIHDPLAPVAVGIDFREFCPDEGTVEAVRIGRPFSEARVKASGVGHAIVGLPPGGHRYRVRCKDVSKAKETTSSDASGIVRVTRASGRVALPPSGATNALEADGRRYTVLYQNLLPRLVFTWRKAPAASAFVLHVEAEGRAPQAIKAPSPSFSFASGELPEGEYRFYWEEPDAGRRSPETVLRLDFDNAAPAAYLRSPPIRIPKEATEVAVEGAVVKGAKVLVQGVPPDLDTHLRFRATARPQPGETAISVRIDHPRTGIHYYVRKFPSGPAPAGSASEGSPEPRPQEP